MLELVIRLDLWLEFRLRLMLIFECLFGYKCIEDDGVVKCIVKECVEFLFFCGFKIFDVLYGCG